jgi:hypothetical protein
LLQLKKISPQNTLIFDMNQRFPIEGLLDTSFTNGWLAINAQDSETLFGFQWLEIIELFRAGGCRREAASVGNRAYINKVRRRGLKNKGCFKTRFNIGNQSKL